LEWKENIKLKLSGFVFYFVAAARLGGCFSSSEFINPDVLVTNQSAKVDIEN
jgi:hypothetical protein